MFIYVHLKLLLKMKYYSELQQTKKKQIFALKTFKLSNKNEKLHFWNKTFMSLLLNKQLSRCQVFFFLLSFLLNLSLQSEMHVLF